MQSVRRESNSFEVYYSFFKIIQQDHIQLISLESGKPIIATDIIRVFQSNFNARSVLDQSPYKIESYSDIKNPQSIFLGEQFAAKSDELSREYGFVFSDLKNFEKYWRKLMLIDLKKTIHIQQEPDPQKALKVWEEFLKEVDLPSNSILLVEPYLNSWYNKNAEEKIQHNLLSVVQALSSSEKISLQILTKSNEEWDNIQMRCINNSSHNMDRCCKALKKLDLQFKIYSFHYVHDKKTRDELINTLHDRYIITNYFLIISTHSMDIINEKNQIIKNTQLIIEPLLSADFFSFYKSKTKCYQKILNWADENHRLKKYVLTKPDGHVKNRHIDYMTEY